MRSRRSIVSIMPFRGPIPNGVVFVRFTSFACIDPCLSSGILCPCGGRDAAELSVKAVGTIIIPWSIEYPDNGLAVAPRL